MDLFQHHQYNERHVVQFFCNPQVQYILIWYFFLNFPHLILIPIEELYWYSEHKSQACIETYLNFLVLALVTLIIGFRIQDWNGAWSFLNVKTCILRIKTLLRICPGMINVCICLKISLYFLKLHHIIHLSNWANRWAMEMRLYRGLNEPNQVRRRRVDKWVKVKSRQK